MSCDRVVRFSVGDLLLSVALVLVRESSGAGLNKEFMLTTSAFNRRVK